VPAVDAAAGDPVQEKVLEIVAEQTGYPPDMLDLDLDLEADLGIDTVKQAEMFAAIRGEWDIPREEDLQLRDFPTLADTIRFVYDRRPDLKAGDAAPAASALETAEPDTGKVPDAAAPGSEEAFPRRIPVALPRPALDLCKASGVEIGAGSRIVVMPDRGGVGRALAGRLEKRGAAVLTLDPEADGDSITATVSNWAAEGGVHGVYWLPALDPTGDPAALELDDWKGALGLRVKLLHRVMRALCDEVSGAGRFLVSATRLGGRHGYDEAGALEPLGGAVAGFTKAFKRERPEAHVKCVDLPGGKATAAFADLLIAETLADPGAVEVGHVDGRRWAIGVEELPRPEEGEGMELDGDSVVVVTGAAVSIVAAIVSDLAPSGATFHLLDLAAEPDPDDPDLQLFAADREALRRRLFERMKESGERATPAKVERQMAGFERLHAALGALAEIRRHGGTAHYHRVDLLDAERMAEVMREIRTAHDRVDLVLHAGGLEISRSLRDKEAAEFDLIFDVKADGWYHLLRGLEGVPIGATVVFSSIAGRFGNSGQTDYSSANDLLCKLTSALRRQRPTTRALALDWTAWGGIGMATRGSIPTVMKAAGIDMLPPEIGVPFIRRELAAGDWAGEIVVGGALGIMAENLDPTGGLEPGLAADGAAGPMIGDAPSLSLAGGLTVETELDPTRQPFLDDHRIDGTPVLPGVMGIEAFAEAARHPFPELAVAAVEEIDFLAPLKFFRDQPRVLTVRVDHRNRSEEIAAACRLVGVRRLPNLAEPQFTTHFEGRVRLAAEPPVSPPIEPLAAAADRVVTAEEIYAIYFHGPAYRVMARAWRAGESMIGELADPLPLHHRPQEAPTLMAPRLIELCFQTAGIRQLATRGTMGLPHHVDRVVRYPEVEAEGPICAVVRAGATADAFDAQVVDARGEILVEVLGYRTIELPGQVDPEALAPLQRMFEDD
jgi:NAD(P)-dependent dehydrogenase (short-subunit alcohol dehydrogenase family)/acyl carrier protein